MSRRQSSRDDERERKIGNSDGRRRACISTQSNCRETQKCLRELGIRVTTVRRKIENETVGCSPCCSCIGKFGIAEIGAVLQNWCLRSSSFLSSFYFHQTRIVPVHPFPSPFHFHCPCIHISDVLLAPHVEPVKPRHIITVNSLILLCSNQRMCNRHVSHQ